jgi:hypothetical protein
MMGRSSKCLVMAGILAAFAPEAQAAEDEKGFWQAQTSVYTRHFSPDPEHNNRQKLIGLEWNQASGWLYGAATFRNSYDQQSVYGYMGQRFESDDYPVYFKLSGGLLYGYKGNYKDKIPLNNLGVAPVIIPGVGLHLGPVTVEAVLLGVSATMINVGVRF